MTRTCPDAEMLALLADGRLPRAQMDELMTHVADCDDCTAAIGAATEVLGGRASRPPATAILAVAATLIIVSIFLFVALRKPDPMSELIALTPESSRPTDARLSGGFTYAPYRGAMRANASETNAKRMKLIGAAGTLVDRAERDASADAQQIAGVALVVIDEPQQAVDRLRAAVKTAPNNAAAWSDLAAAQLATALRFDRHALLPEALVSADRALQIDPKLPEALFNRAVILERLGLTQEARAAWQAYLAVDATSPWAKEARERLAHLPSPSSASQENTRAFAEVEHLGRWAEGFAARDAAAAQRSLDRARNIGDQLVRTHGESLLRDAVRTIDEAPDRTMIAQAHAVYRRGRLAYSRQRLDEAHADLSRAASLFEAARSPMALVARYYAANVRFDRNDIAGARAALEVLLDEVARQPRFHALAAQVRWELALCLMVDGDWSGAMPLLERSCDAFARLHESQSLGFVESLLADTALSLGRIDEGWAARIRAFGVLSADARGNRLPVSLRSAATMEMRAGRPHVARALLELSRSAARNLADPMLATDSLVRATLVNATLGDRDAATRSLRDARAAAGGIADPSLQELARSYLQFAEAATILDSDPARARDLLTAAIDTYRTDERQILLPEPYLLRARAEARRGNGDAAAADLESGIAALERAPLRIGATVGTGILDAGVALFDDAIRLRLDRGDVDAALRTIERSRRQPGASRIGARELQQRLAGSATAVIELASLPDEFIAICVTARDVNVARTPLARASVEALARRGDREAAGKLYELVVRPFDPMLANVRHLIVVSDPRLDSVPFASLFDEASRRYLVERFSVSTAPGASALGFVANDARAPMIAVALPAGDAAALPESARELRDILKVHPGADMLGQATFDAFVASASTAGVIHIAGHTERRSEDAGPSLRFANGRVSASMIARERFPQSPVVLLAACETLRRSSSNLDALALGTAFLSAGASDVVGTLAPIADADARRLFHTIHRRLEQGDVPAEAVRAAQLEALSRRDPSWPVVASLTRRIAR